MKDYEHVASVVPAKGLEHDACLMNLCVRILYEIIVVVLRLRKATECGDSSRGFVVNTFNTRNDKFQVNILWPSDLGFKNYI